MNRMSKELEALYRLATRNSGHRSVEEVDKDFKIVEKALKDYESIDNANPSEALEEIKTLRGFNQVELNNDENVNKSLDIIEQALLKAQENARSEEILQKYYQEGITLDSVRALKQERDNYKKILEIIKEKDVDIYILTKCKIVDEYNSKIVHIVGETRELTQEEFKLLKGILNDEQ